VFVSTHLISEFEGLIDEFTIIDRGREILTLDADAARERYQKIYARFASDPGTLDLAGAHVLRRLVLMAGLVALVLRFSLANYRSADRDPRGVGHQVSCIAAALAIAQIILTGTVALHWPDM
jgi:hypothetical protein